MTQAPLRRPLIAGNWKMNNTLQGAVDLAQAVKAGVDPGFGREVMIAPPFTALALVARVLEGSAVGLGAQDLHWEDKGAFTGEVSPAQIVDAGCRYAIIGHSERRHILGETDAVVGKKLRAALRASLIPILCVGETLEERQSQQMFLVLQRQVTQALEGSAPGGLSALVLAYEPVWAIGTGQTAKPHQAQEAHLHIRKLLAKTKGEPLAQSARILYGGSVKPDNIGDLMAQPDVDGVLVGGDSLNPESFLKIAHYAQPDAAVAGGRG